MSKQHAVTLTDPQNGNLAFKILDFSDNSFFDHIQRNNYYSLIWIQHGEGELKVDFSTYNFYAASIVGFSPYQPFMLKPVNDLKGVAIQFHSDFFCIHKHQQEIACNGILFNNIYQNPIIEIDGKTKDTITLILEQMKIEVENYALAQSELLQSYLKILLINLSRLKSEQGPDFEVPSDNLKEAFVVKSLQEAIENNYRQKHSASEYAEIMNLTTKSLSRIAKLHFNKSVTALIAERIIIEAKRELYLTDKPVKQIAYELGYMDEFYFSRFFKAKTDISPQLYRNTVGFNKLSYTTN